MNQRQNTPALETNRLLLRQFNKNDVNALLALHSDEAVNQYLPWFPLKSLKQAESFFEKQYAEFYQSPKGYRYAVCLKTKNIPIGYVHVNMDDSYDLGYGLQKAFWRQGIISEAAGAVIEQLKKDRVPYITATHDIHNISSGGVMKKLGMRYQYTYEEWWRPKNFLVQFRMYQLNLDGQENRVYKKYWDTSPVHFIERGI